MIQPLLVPIPKLAGLKAELNRLYVAGFLPLTACFVPADDGPGAILFTLGKVSEPAPAVEPIAASPDVPAVDTEASATAATNGTNGADSHTLPAPEVIPSVGS